MLTLRNVKYEIQQTAKAFKLEKQFRLIRYSSVR